MTARHQITAFHLPPDGLITTALLWTIIPFGALASPALDSSPLHGAAQLLHSYVSQPTFKWILALLVAMHSVECVYTLSLCIKYKAPFKATVAYAVAGFFMGLPAWRDIRRRAAKSA
ncbi:hypothetical protein C8R46DRAFT_1058610 [Mycena filopes]|nr:hypothetical protein C8R46DRAFT_1058610 [Mycena filopes]